MTARTVPIVTQAVKYAFAEGEREAVRRQMIALLEFDLPAAA